MATGEHQDDGRSRRVLVVFDYDWSLVNENSDTFIFQQLCPALLEELNARRATQPSWTLLMDELLTELSVRCPHVTRADIQRVVAAIPIQERMLEALRRTVEQYGADVVIISDANTMYIQSMLELHGLTEHVKRVFTNPAAFEDGTSRLRVAPFHALDQPPHGCAWCPANMCKGAILDGIRRETPYDVVLYVGDGGGDFCPSTRLTSRDVVFARDNDAHGKPYGLLKKLRVHADKIHARVVPWRTGVDIFDGFEQALQ